jgi:diguanylate cyclase (GGDEF)-like protein
MSAPLAYQGWDSVLAADIFTEVLITSAIALVACKLMASVRAQRIALQRSGDEAEQRALADPLTGLENRRAFDDALVTEVARARRSGDRVSVLVADVDGFKEINDRLGHLEGDRRLIAVARALRGAVRQGDRCFRWGGDEFAAVLPGASPAEAHLVARRIATALEAPSDGRVTLTCGVAELIDGMSGQDLLHAADMALVAAKADRRANRAAAA